jgi:hypothetical protein
MTLAPFFVYIKGEEKILKNINLKIYHPSGVTFDVVILTRYGIKR